METHTVPEDGIMEPKHVFQVPDLAVARDRFAAVHEVSERVYKGDGVWSESDLGQGCPPVYRHTAWRMIGYVNALMVEDNPVYRERIEAGAEYLLREQQDNGSFLWWCYETHGHPDSDHLLYCTANPGIALLELYKLTDDHRFLEGSTRAADWACQHGIARNNNYNSFAVWHLCEHYKVTGDVKYLDAAIYRNEEGGFPRQLPNGAWEGHNAWIFYHSIIVRGFAALFGVLPDDHPAKVELRAPTIKALNHMIEEQCGNGHFRSCFDPEEWQKSREPDSHYNVHTREEFDPSTLHALVCIQDLTKLDMGNALHGAIGSPMPADLEGQGMVHLAYGVAYRWLSAQGS
jgi:hypothetical protein